MNLTRPIASLDIESATQNKQPDPTVDRIITLALVMQWPNGESSSRDWMVNPGIEIKPENTAIHGITNAMVKGLPLFSQRAQQVADAINGADLMGFGLIRYDVPLLWEEFYRAGIKWTWRDHKIIDVGNLYKKREPRNLEAAVLFYFNRRHTGAHGALADAGATADVLEAMLGKYELPLTVPELAKESQMEEEDSIDLARTVVVDKDGVARYMHKKMRGVAVMDDPGYAEWIINKDFPAETKITLRRYLDTVIYPAQRKAERAMDLDLPA